MGTSLYRPISFDISLRVKLDTCALRLGSQEQVTIGKRNDYSYTLKSTVTFSRLNDPPPQ